MQPLDEPEVFKTPSGTPYLKEAGVTLVSSPQFHSDSMERFLDGFDKNLGFESYARDLQLYPMDADQLCKVAGQLCYMSFGPGHTTNVDTLKYLTNMLRSGHGSVFEHANFTLLLYGTSRSLTHELVRHRAGFSYSQVSQRYVDGRMLRFVERPEYQGDPGLHELFKQRIDKAYADYTNIAEYLIVKQGEGSELLSGEKARDRRKKVNQTARSVLPNETEAPIIVTGNVRAWRHFIEMRASEYAEVEIRALAIKVYKVLHHDSLLFQDYGLFQLSDGTEVLDTPYKKV